MLFMAQYWYYFGALFATLMASGFKIHRRLNLGDKFLAAALGGLMMGYGARIAAGL